MLFVIKELAQELEGYETEQWPVERILDVELMTHKVIDPCVGFGVFANEAKRRGHQVKTLDIHVWDENNPPDIVRNFLHYFEDATETTFFFNGPFSLVCEFVDHMRMMNARKIICFQRYAWREGCLIDQHGKPKRGTWWEANPPARIWLCGDRAQCIRFDLRDQVIAKPPTAHAFFIWERGHRGAEITRGLYKR